MWSSVATASLASDYESPQLAVYSSDEALQLWTHLFSANRQNGLVSKGQPIIDPQVADASATQVHINDCVDESNWLLYHQDGSPLDNVPGGRHKTEATVTYANGAWKVSAVLIRPVGTC